MMASQNHNFEDEFQMDQEEEQRNWEELNGDILLVIFRMVGIIDVLKSVRFVCRAWRKAARDEPELWIRIDMTNNYYSYEPFMLMHLTKLAIDRSRGRLEEFWIESFCDDELLQYLGDR
ncbi:hypothetical protein LUZ60_009084 [Juncus effusus]|nr:hypothetical protein LUZ60_009084 [Juncus effusus]